MGIVTLLVLAAALIWSIIGGTQMIGTGSVVDAWRRVGSFIDLNLGDDFLLLIFLGLWLGAASHTFTDMAGTFIKTGRAEKFF
jgi:uncharacterized metal-binding protein